MLVLKSDKNDFLSLQKYDEARPQPQTQQSLSFHGPSATSYRKKMTSSQQEDFNKEGYDGKP